MPPLICSYGVQTVFDIHVFNIQLMHFDVNNKKLFDL